MPLLFHDHMVQWLQVSRSHVDGLQEQATTAIAFFPAMTLAHTCTVWGESEGDIEWECNRSLAFTDNSTNLSIANILIDNQKYSFSSQDCT